MIRRLIPLCITLALLLAACGGSPQKIANTGQNSNSVKGQELFAQNCGECHGEDGTGTDEAPDVRGHTVEQVNTQVRNPEGDMEAIAPDKLSDADLALIADYIVSLGGEEAHPDIMPTGEERTHLEAAFKSIEDYENIDRPTAISHLEQAVALASAKQTADLYQEMLDSVKEEKAGNARHELKELLGMEEEH